MKKTRLALFAVFCALVSSAGVAHQKSSPRFLSFPKGFNWCVATSAHQIEGYNENSDWWDWEHQPGHIKNGEVSGAACDHWNRLEEDADLIRALHATKYRFSVEWAKIQPREGVWDLEALEHYRREVLILRERGIEPFITLQHFTLPRWVAAHGGLEWAGFSEAFTLYAKRVVGELAPLGVRDWVTFNEPMVVIAGGYVRGVFPPGHTAKSVEDVLRPIEGFLRAHARAYHELKAVSPGIRIGLAHHLRLIDPANPVNPLSRVLAFYLDKAFNWAFFNAIETGRLQFKAPVVGKIDIAVPGLKGSQDYVGVNYYSRDVISIDRKAFGYVKFGPKRGRPVNDLNWEIYPKGFHRILKEVAKRVPSKPILITENGIADSRDAQRPSFIVNHLRELHRAMAEGIRIEAYCHWSLMDNFEWAEGFTPRFGLYEVDYKTFKRTPRASARIFSKIARENGLWVR